MRFYKIIRFFSWERKFHKNIDRVFSVLSVPREELLITDELMYPQTVVVNYEKYPPLSRKMFMKAINMSRLPIRITERILKVTQIPCSPLEFQPVGIRDM